MNDAEYAEALHPLHVELVRLQRHVIAAGERLLIVFEGRDAAGKDGVIRVLTQHWSPREFRVFAPGKPTERERSSWYFQRFVAQLPAAGEIVCFNRSWYNRAGVEPVMGYCTRAQTERFLRDVKDFERLLAADGVRILKFYLDISRKEQARRLEARRTDPLKQWKISPVAAQAQKLWPAYSAARDAMLRRSSHPAAPWMLVQADKKKQARLAVLRQVLAETPFPGRDRRLARPAGKLVRAFRPGRLRDGTLAR